MAHALSSYPLNEVMVLGKQTNKLFFQMASHKVVSRVRNNSLTKSFMNVAEKSGLKIAFKLAAAGTAGALGANVYVVALAGGLGVTIAEAIKDYRDIQNQEINSKKGILGSIKNFFGFINKEKIKYTGKFIKNSGLGLIGAEIGSHIGEIKDAIMSIPGMSEFTKSVGKFAQSLFNGVLGIRNAYGQDIQSFSASQNIAPLEIAAQPQVINIYETLSHINKNGWDAQALADFKAAQDGKSWALQNLAHYAANGLHGMSVNFETARALAEEAGRKGSKLSAKFLSELDLLSGHPVVHYNSAVDLISPAKSEILNSVGTKVLSQFSTANLDAQALADFKAAQAGKSWALQNLAHYAANGLHGMSVNYETARTLAEEAGRKGSKLSAKFLSELGQGLDEAPLIQEKVKDILTATETANNTYYPENIDFSPINIAAAADSNVCTVSSDGLKTTYEQFAKVDFVMDCKNPDSLIPPGKDVIVVLTDSGEKLSFTNGSNRDLSVADMAEYVTTTLLYNPELLKQSENMMQVALKPNAF